MTQFDEPSSYDGQSHGLFISGHFHVNDSYSTHRPSGMDDWLITFTLSGEGYFITPERETRCSRGDIVLMRPGVPHKYGTVKGEVWNFIWAHFSPLSVGDSLLPAEPLYVHTIEPFSIYKRVHRAFRRILSDSRERHEYWQDLCLNSLREILLVLAQQKNHTLDPRVEEVLHYLSNHMRHSVEIEELARTIGLSASRMSHLFKEQTGQSIIDALNQMRIRQAALLLEHTNRSASEISFEVGFHNYNHFIRQFRKWMGTTPSCFKRHNDRSSGTTTLKPSKPLL